MKATILKFGGSSFRQPGDYIGVARHLADRRAAGDDKIVVTVSAMSGVTDSLKNTLLAVDRDALPSSLDAALATGEMFSACMLEAAVYRLGIPVTSFNGYTLGIRTNSDFGRASIDCANPQPILTALQEHDVVIAAGGQGIDPSGRLTFLGRNSSDLTAVVIASMLGEHTCEIYSDVRGVYTADPYLFPEAELIPEIAYAAIAQMSRHGAKVLHYRAVDYAEKHKVTIICKSLMGDEVSTGTIITTYGNRSGSVTVARNAAVLALASNTQRDSLSEVLCRNDVKVMSFEEDCGPCLWIMTDIEFATRLIALAGTDPAAVVSRTIVTDIEDTLTGVYIYADYERAIEVAREIHARKHAQH